MKQPSIHSRSTPRGASPLILALIALVSLLGWRTATTQSVTGLNAFSPAALSPVQNQSQPLYLHGTGPANNPPTIFLDATAPTGSSSKYKDSTSVNRNGGNPWKEVGTWSAAASQVSGTVTSLSDLHSWLGLKNSDDQGTYFDVRAEAYINGTLLTSGQTLCVNGVTTNPANAKEVLISFGSFSPTVFNGSSDLLKLKILARVGSDASGNSCGGHNNAVGLRVYFDATNRSSSFILTTGTADSIPPVLTVSAPANDAITSSDHIPVAGTFNDQSPTTITLNGTTLTTQNNSFTTSALLNEGPNDLLFAATDASGNRTEVTRRVIRDSVAPALTIDAPAANTVTRNSEAVVSGTFNDATATTIQVNNVVAVLNGNSYSATVPLSEGQNTITVVATDAVQHTTQLVRDLVRDSTPPTIAVLRPVDGSATNQSQVEVRGVLDDATATSITVENVAATLTGNDFTATTTLAQGANTIHVRAIDAAGNQTETTVSVTFDTTPPTLLVATPVADTTTNNKILAVSGSSSDALPVTVTANEQTLTTESNGTFNDLVALSEGNNQIVFVAKDAAGNQSQAIVRSVLLDATSPQISQITPAAGALIRSATSTIQGHITDATPLVVKLNNVVVNTDAAGNFSAENVSIIEGENRFSISAKDAAGNETVTILTLTGGDVTAPAAPQLFAINPLTRLAFQTIEGRAEPDAQVTISGGVEVVNATAAQGTGLFVANVNLAPGASQLSVTATDASGNVSTPTQLAITSNPNLATPAGQAYQINSASGNAQHSLVGVELPRPLIALVTDQTGAPVPGVIVHFTVVEGGGRFLNGPTKDSVTDAQGHASAQYTSGSNPGVQIVRATFDTNTSTPAVFSAEAFGQSNGATTVSGVVLDQDLRALPNVLVRISGQQTRTGVDGRFKLLSVPAGPHQLLELVGRDQVSLPGRWPNITYDFDVLPGVDNNLGRPLFLPRVNDGVNLPLDNNNVVTQDTTVELPVGDGVPPIQITALAGTHVSFPPDVTDKRMSVTRIATNRVPMVLEEGRATNLYISVQPSGALFDQPLRITFPNLDEQPPNAAVLLMSFDHDAGRYVQVGTGHVSADGQSVTSDPGSGIRVGAWHGLPPPPPRPEITVLGHIRVKDNPIFDKRAINTAEAWVEGVSAIQVSSPEVDDRLDFRATYTLSPGAAPRPVRLESTVAADEFNGHLEVHVFNPDGSPVARGNSTTSPTGDRLLARSDRSNGGPSAAGPALESIDANGEDPSSGQQPSPSPSVAYGGSKDALSDQFDVVLNTDAPLDKIKSITWSVSGPGGENYQLPDPLAKAMSIHVHAQLPAGLQTFKSVIRYRRGGTQTLTQDMDIGVRTDDLIALGWIDIDNVPLSDAGVRVRLSASDMPLEGGPTNLLDRVRCNQDIGHLAINDIDYFTGNGFIAPPLNPAERIYILNWMFKYAGSHSPVSLTGGDFQGSDGLVSEEKVASFIANHTTSYKVINRLQVEYRVSADGERYNGTPTIRHSANALGARTVGLTRNPCGAIAGFAGTFDTQQGFADMKTVSQVDYFGQISDGSPDSSAITAFNTLTGKDVDPGQTAKFWEDVGSQIAFPTVFGQVGKFILQPYPTFYLYRNGALIDVHKQAPNPIDHFFLNPYPFGNVPCTFFTNTTPGGRCGDAKSPPAPGSRVPPYVQDLLHPPL